MRVGRFIGRLGVVPMPAVERGLGLVERVVRRHVAKLVRVGWCERMAAIRGDGSLVWLTGSGLQGVGLGELPALRAPELFAPRTQHSVGVAWAAAEIEHAGHRWYASRELALEPGRWAAEIANERGAHSRRLPDLVFWPSLDDGLPVAVVVARWLANPRRERAALEGWQAAVTAGRYAQVRYVAGPAANHLSRLASEIGLTAPQFVAAERVVADQPPVLPETVDEASVVAETPPVAAPDPPRPSPALAVPQRSRSEKPVETPKRAAERQKFTEELLGHGEPARRRWRRRAT